MAEWLHQFAPNVVEKFPELIESFWQTLVMMGGSGVISFFFGLIFGVALIVTRPGGVLQNGLFTACWIKRSICFGRSRSLF